MRKAASGWEDDYVRKLANDEFERGRSSSTMFYYVKSRVSVVVHDIALAPAEQNSGSFVGRCPSGMTSRCGVVVKREEIGQEEDEEMLRRTERTELGRKLVCTT